MAHVRRVIVGFLGLTAAAFSLAVIMAGLHPGLAEAQEPPPEQASIVFTDVAAGGSVTCAEDLEGAVHCWGATPANGAQANNSVPAPVANVGAVAQIGAGRAHVCAVSVAGKASCWGDNSAGQLGDGTTDSSSAPTGVTGIVGEDPEDPEATIPLTVIEVGAGDAHSCALTTNRLVFCWGDNSNGQLGDGSTTASSAAVPVAGLSDVVSIGVGSDHTCAIRADGTALCWGSNDAGQLLDETTIDRSTPVAITGITDAKAVTAGDAHSCALRVTGRIICWGDNSNGLLGNGTTTQSSLPVAARRLNGATSVSAGANHTCATITGGGVKCWGLNEDNLLGDGSGVDRSSPVDVAGLSDATEVSVGTTHTCATTEAGKTYCWGINGEGQLGTGDTESHPTPTAVIFEAPATETMIGGTITTADGTPVADVQVDLFNEGRVNYLTSTTTAEDGTFSFEVEAACYVLTAVAPEEAIFVSGATYRNLPVCVDEGETISDLDATLVGADAQLELTGQVTQGGEAVEGLVVDLFSADAEGVRGDYLFSTTSDATGTYRFTTPGPGCYTATLIAPEGSGFGPQLATYANEWLCAEVGPTATFAPVSLAGSSDLATVAVTIVSQAFEVGVEGVAVDLFAATADGSRGTYLRTATTDADGVASFEVQAGCFVAVAIAPDGEFFENGTEWAEMAGCVEAEGQLDLTAVLILPIN